MKLISTLCFCCLTTALLAGDPIIGGTIHFQNGRKLVFYKIEKLNHFASISQIREPEFEKLRFSTGSKMMTVPFTALEKLEIKIFETYKDRWRGEALKDVVLDLEGSKQQMLGYLDALYSVEVQVLDHKTGQLSTHVIPFAELGRLNIRSIKFKETRIEALVKRVKAKPEPNPSSNPNKKKKDSPSASKRF